MSLKLLADTSCILDFQDPTHSGTITIQPASVSSADVKIQGEEVYISIAFIVTNFSGGPVVNGTGAGVIIGSTTKTRLSSLSPVREDDSVTILITDSVGSPPPTVNTTVFVDNAGQTKAKAQ